MNRKSAHIFNIDNLLIKIDQKVWIIDKSDPNKCLMKISKEDFDLMRSGAFKEQDLSLKFNGKTYWLSQDIFDRLKKSVKKLANSENLSFSFREFTDKDTLSDLDISYDLSPIEHLKNTNDEIYFLSTKGTEERYGHVHTKLIDKLNEEGIIVKQSYHLNQSYFAQNKDINIKKICYVILSNVLGRDIKNNELGDDLNRDYESVNYYDTNYVTINKIKYQINSFLRRFDLYNEDNTKLYVHLVGSNKLKPFSTEEVKLDRYVKTFEGFNKSKKKAKLDIHKKFSDLKENVEMVETLLNKYGFEHDFHELKTYRDGKYVKERWYQSLVYYPGREDRYELELFIKENKVGLMFVGKDRYAKHGTAYNIMELVKNISEYIPEAFTINLYRNLNKS